MISEKELRRLPMIDTDFIKWKVGYADGFEMDELAGYAPYVIYADRRNIAKYITKWEHYPLLLQKAIEGINRAEIFQIYQAEYGISVYKRIRESKYAHELYEFKKYDSADQAKTAALKYVYEQEKINENK